MVGMEGQWALKEKPLKNNRLVEKQWLWLKGLVSGSQRQHSCVRNRMSEGGRAPSPRLTYIVNFPRECCWHEKPQSFFWDYLGFSPLKAGLLALSKDHIEVKVVTGNHFHDGFNSLEIAATSQITKTCVQGQAWEVLCVHRPCLNKGKRGQGWEEREVHAGKVN